jgi:sugar porter (SP) family MFS transporter
MKGYVVRIASVAALGGLLFGFDTAVIAGTLNFLTKAFILDDSQLGLVVSATSIGCIPGAGIAGKLADTYGRKKMLVLTALLYIIAALGSGLATGFVSLVAFRLIGGIAIGMASTIAPIYISEIAPANFRGRLGMLQQLAIVTGILLSSISNYAIVNVHTSFLHEDNFWRYMLGAALIPSLVFFLLLMLVPESPRWLTLKGMAQAGEKIFERIFGSKQQAEEQMKEIETESGTEGTSGLKEVFSSRYKKIVIIGLVFAGLAQLTGINIVFYYAPLIFDKTHTGLSPLLQTLLLGIANLLFTILAFGFIDKYGRKKLLLIGSGVMSLCMLVLGILFWAGQLNNFYVLVAIFLYIGGFACSWGAVVWVYVAEIFPNKIRGTATSIAVMGNWTANAIVTQAFPIMLNKMGGGPTFLVYAVLNALMILFVTKYLFETKGIKLEDIEKAYQ